ncbi:hypothetical protein BU26DRAFT_349076 [Trematosphaeria pertusa]|uniref:Uncharacterized protein n=1 Tax=Trematosphaeria pertusa TaxID=390896 RepID=A0A6A6IAD2_9PLEO|nr:uncharacterized protein BU26DRAFT_349076 [Trematosphaeria pertusa]KAF2247525.1 hypothetical protein BU26DRAFT_349076 [Trematosphaeria pertusa]
MPLLTNFIPAADLDRKAAFFAAYASRTLAQAHAQDHSSITKPLHTWARALLLAFEGILRGSPQLAWAFFDTMDCLEAWAWKNQAESDEVKKWLPGNGEADGEAFRAWLEGKGKENVGVWEGIKAFVEEGLEGGVLEEEEGAGVPEFFGMVRAARKWYGV